MLIRLNMTFLWLTDISSDVTFGQLSLYTLPTDLGKQTSPADRWDDHLTLLQHCKNCILVPEIVPDPRKGKGECWEIAAGLHGATNVFLAYILIKSISTVFLKSFRQIYISAVFTICLVICICVSVYFYFRMFRNKTMLGHSTLSKHATSSSCCPFQACCETGFIRDTGKGERKYRLKLCLRKDSRIFLNCVMSAVIW